MCAATVEGTEGWRPRRRHVRKVPSSPRVPRGGSVLAAEGPHRGGRRDRCIAGLFPGPHPVAGIRGGAGADWEAGTSRDPGSGAPCVLPYLPTGIRRLASSPPLRARSVFEVRLRVAASELGVLCDLRGLAREESPLTPTLFRSNSVNWFTVYPRLGSSVGSLVRVCAARSKAAEVRFARSLFGSSVVPVSPGGRVTFAGAPRISATRVHEGHYFR